LDPRIKNDQRKSEVFLAKNWNLQLAPKKRVESLHRQMKDKCLNLKVILLAWSLDMSTTLCIGKRNKKPKIGA
jgi:hypothetical protein